MRPPPSPTITTRIHTHTHSYAHRLLRNASFVSCNELFVARGWEQGWPARTLASLRCDDLDDKTSARTTGDGRRSTTTTGDSFDDVFDWWAIDGGRWNKRLSTKTTSLCQVIIFELRTCESHIDGTGNISTHTHTQTHIQGTHTFSADIPTVSHCTIPVR